jgi:hypothetical protein
VEDIDAFYKQYEPNLKHATLLWRIYKLIQANVLERKGRGKYALGSAKPYEPFVDLPLKRLYQQLTEQFPFATLAVWTTRWLNEWMIHQPGSFYRLVETEPEVAEAVFYFLRDRHSGVFLLPAGEVLRYYLPNEPEPIVVRHLVSQAPLLEIDEVRTASLEKILVDLFCDAELFASFGGAELENIFREAFKTYSINLDRLYRYAGRRRRKEAIAQFLQTL